MPSPSKVSHRQHGFSLIEVMTASMILSIFIAAMGACWITADRQVNDLVLRQKAIFAANGEMERLTVLYDTTSFGVLGPVSTSGYDGPAFLPANRLIYPNSLAGYSGGPGSDFATTSTATFLGDPFAVYITSQLLRVMNRSYLWVDQSQGVMARVSWKATSISPASCTGGDGCGCLSYSGLFSGSCQRIDLYLEYPYRLASGSPVADSTLQTVILSTIVGRHT
ncbi:MAG: prepilin-type N-terminal cleavage/methylation domain-containing protein [Alphaproteobacteria bacterium]|nr:prepilin-type N-terminal cleavage/methylation domain-containing protein [Alphaproteobacteria bacterium]